MNGPLSASPIEADNVGTVTFSNIAVPEVPSSCGCNAPNVAALPEVTPTVTSPSPQLGVAPIVTVYINPTVVKTINDTSSNEADEVLFEIGLDVNSYNPETEFSTKGTVLKTLKFSKAQLLQDMLANQSKSVTTVEDKKEKENAQRLRELAGISGKGTWV